MLKLPIFIKKNSDSTIKENFSHAPNDSSQAPNGDSAGKDNGQEDTAGSVGIPSPWLAVGGVLVTLITSLGTFGGNIATNYFKDKPAQEVSEHAQLLKKQNFELILLKTALQLQDPEQRAQSLLLMVEMKLLDIPKSTMDDFIKNAKTVPQWPPESSEKPADQGASSGKDVK